MDAVAQRNSTCCDLVCEVARRWGEVQLKLTGTSMVPAVWPGDVVTIQRCEFGELQPGQIVLYRGEGFLTVHRLLRVSNDQLILRGDSLFRCDPPVREPEVVGRVVGIVRDGHQVSLRRPMRHRFLSWMVRRSEFCMRVTLRLGSSL